MPRGAARKGTAVDPLTTVLFIAGFVCLLGGAELLVRGASRLAAAAGISPLVVGLTVVAFGTSAPELAVSLQSVWTEQANLSLGNVIGSNILNVLFILGLSALVTPLVVARQLVQLDVPLMIGASVLVLILAVDGGLSRIDGLALFLLMVAYTVFLIWQSRRDERAARQANGDDAGEATANGTGVASQLGLVTAGLGLLVLGSRWLVDGATTLATAMGVSDLIIGLTVVAIGTSLPEVATSVIASLRGERDIAVGNIVGSNLANLLLVLGVAGALSPAGLPVATALTRFDLPIMIAVAVACLPIFFTGHLIARWEGAVFLAYYLAYTLYLILDATGHDAIEEYSLVMLAFVLPLTAITLIVLGWRAFAAHRRHERNPRSAA